MPNKKYQKKRQLPPKSDAWPKKELFLFEPKTLIIIIITSALTLLVAFFGEHGVKFLSSVISPVPAHAPFDGTTFPIKQMPNWVKLTEIERKSAFNAIPQEKLIALVAYNPTRLAIPIANLKWNDPNDDAIRNEKITYSVPYLGTYKLEGVEGIGSHPAIDIKAPTGTPVYAMANGTVIKSEYTNGGFGNHIVLQHNDFPSFADQNVKTAYYSSYSHLSSISVNKYEIIKKGQLIGFVGDSGTATTPHLHFQIDNDKSSWHPYWPFTGSDMKAAGVSFFEAINTGLKKENAIEYTVNPMKYVQKYAGDNSVLMASSQPELIQALNIPDPYENIMFMAQTAGGNRFKEGDVIQFVIQAFDEKGNLLSKPDFKEPVTVSLLNGAGKLNLDKLTSSDLISGISNVLTLSAEKAGPEKLLLRFREKEFSSPEFLIEPKAKNPSAFSLIVSKTELEPNETISVEIRAFGDAGQQISEFVLSEAVSTGLTNAVGILGTNAFSEANFANGIATTTFTASLEGQTEIFVNYKGQVFKSTVLVVKAPAPPPPTENAPAELSEPVQPVQPTETAPLPEPLPPPVSTEPVQPPPPPPSVILPFTDILADSKYFAALTELKGKGLVAGYADGTFQPDKEVSRAEAVTFILRVINAIIKENLSVDFPDVLKQAWYSKFIATAYVEGFVKGYPDGLFRPEDRVNLAEFLTMLFVAEKADIDPQIEISLPAGVNATDWFAPYVQEAIKKNIIDVQAGALDASKPMTRGEISEILYRLMQAEKADVRD
ncbi:S-layer homology domain-containing protein [Candidatus Peregrinibacteria bacterium]|nr:S-layer homology domain-containing protein [Candidatus Peregrinibacteria bacterium]